MYHKPLAYGIRVGNLRKIAEKHESLEINHIRAIIENILEDTWKLVRRDLTWWITRFVPRMTGRLRRDLYKHLMDSYIRNHILRVFIQTSVDYAKRVNDFETHNVRHKGKKIKYRGKTITLYDPHAIGHFFDIMVKFAIRIINRHLNTVKKKYASRTQLKLKDMRIIKLW